MTDFVKDQVDPEEMIQVGDIAEVVRVLLRQSPGCIVPEVISASGRAVSQATPSSSASAALRRRTRA